IRGRFAPHARLTTPGWSFHPAVPSSRGACAPEGVHLGQAVEDAFRFGTASACGAGARSRGESGWLPGHLLTLHDNHMGLDNYPVRCKCGKHSYPDDVPDEGSTHREDE